MLRLYWHCLDLSNSEKSFIAGAVGELARLLGGPPVELRLEAEPLGPDIAQVVEGHFRNPPDDPEEPFTACWEPIAWELRTLSVWTPLLVACAPDSTLAEAARKQSPGAVWGLAVPNLVAAVYEGGSKHILWHEALHLWGADDCYLQHDPHSAPQCGLAGCIMQYAPTAATVCTWPFICEGNVDAIRSWAERPRRPGGNSKGTDTPLPGRS